MYLIDNKLSNVGVILPYTDKPNCFSDKIKASSLKLFFIAMLIIYVQIGGIILSGPGF